MATYTTNINLKKPAQSDKIRIADFNGNADNIDAAFGADFGQSSKPSVNASINNLADGLAIVAQGNVHAAISAGKFVYVRGHGTLGEGLYVANQAISANGTLSSSNLDADTSGGLNALNSKLNNPTTFSLTASSGVTVESTYTQCFAIGKLAIIVARFSLSSASTSKSITLGSVPNDYKPNNILSASCHMADNTNDIAMNGVINADGTIVAFRNNTDSTSSIRMMAVYKF